MVKRKIIKIDEEKCTGCGACIPNCPEGALRVIDGKARLLSDLFCDGLGACIGRCPEDAITIEERGAEPYDEKKVMENIVKQGPDVVKAHLLHLKEHGEKGYLQQAVKFLKDKNIAVPNMAGGEHRLSGCPGSRVMDFRRKKKPVSENGGRRHESELRQWPVQLMLVPPHAPYLNNADLVISADCVPFAYANFHEDFLKSRILLVGCPKLDDTQIYRDKLTEVFRDNEVRSVTYVHMEVPCCFGLLPVIEEAITSSGKDIPFEEVTISIGGEKSGE